jgi:uncharacterized protein (TIGR02284 family)
MVDYESNESVNANAAPIHSENESIDNVISALNGLIETCKDGQEGFKEAAEGVERSELKTTFYEFSQQRSEFAGVLQELVRSLGGDPENAGSFTGALHRGWIDIKSAVTGQDEEAILNECERGEDSAKAAYNTALELALPSNVNDIVRQQYQAVLAAHNRIKALRDTERHRTANPGA